MRFVPCSGLCNQNLREPHNLPAEAAWYSGQPTLLQLIGRCPQPCSGSQRRFQSLSYPWPMLTVPQGE